MPTPRDPQDLEHFRLVGLERFHQDWVGSDAKRKRASGGQPAAARLPHPLPTSGAVDPQRHPSQPQWCPPSNAGVFDDSDEDENMFQHFAHGNAI